MNRLQLPYPIYYHNMPNGLKTAVVRKHGFSHSFALLVTNFGSINKQVYLPNGQVMELPSGIAHFLEHQLFEEPEGSISNRFAALGVQENAYTHFSQTGYYFVTSDNFWPALKLLLQFTQNPHFTDASVLAEKSIIAQELKMYEDDPGSQGDLLLRRSLFGSHPAADDIGGTHQSLTSITPDLLYHCHQTYYHPSNMALVVVGDIDPEKLYNTIDQTMGNYSGAPFPSIPSSPVDSEPVHQPVAIKKMHISRPLAILGYKEIFKGQLTGREQLQRQIETELALDCLFGKSSSFYWELYSQGLITDDFSGDYMGEEGFSYISIGGESPHPHKLTSILSKYIQKSLNHPPEADTIERLKRKSMGEYIMSFNNSDGLAFSLASMILTNLRYDDVPTIINDITSHSISQRMAQCLDASNLVQVYVEPTDQN